MGNIYEEPEVYDAAHWWKTNDVDFIVGRADKCGSPVLELAAGTGRLALPILERGHTYVGLDSSKEYVSLAERKLAPFGRQGAIRYGDMRDFDMGVKFKFCFIGFNSLLHLLTNDEVLSCFRCVYKHLLDGGKFLIDIFVPDPIFLYREPGKLYEVMRFEHPRGGECIVKERNEYDPETQINHIYWYFFRDAAKEPELYSFDMHMIYPDTMDRLLTEAGFRIEEKLGDYDGRPMDENSPLQIYICVK